MWDWRDLCLWYLRHEVILETDLIWVSALVAIRNQERSVMAFWMGVGMTCCCSVT